MKKTILFISFLMMCSGFYAQDAKPECDLTTYKWSLNTTITKDIILQPGIYGEYYYKTRFAFQFGASCLFAVKALYTDDFSLNEKLRAYKSANGFDVLINCKYLIKRESKIFKPFIGAGIYYRNAYFGYKPLAMSQSGGSSTVYNCCHQTENSNLAGLKLSIGCMVAPEHIRHFLFSFYASLMPAIAHIKGQRDDFYVSYDGDNRQLPDVNAEPFDETRGVLKFDTGFTI